MVTNNVRGHPLNIEYTFAKTGYAVRNFNGYWKIMKSQMLETIPNDAYILRKYTHNVYKHSFYGLWPNNNFTTIHHLMKTFNFFLVFFTTFVRRPFKLEL